MAFPDEFWLVKFVETGGRKSTDFGVTPPNSPRNKEHGPVTDNTKQTLRNACSTKKSGICTILIVIICAACAQITTRCTNEKSIPPLKKV